MPLDCSPKLLDNLRMAVRDVVFLRGVVLRMIQLGRTVNRAFGVGRIGPLGDEVGLLASGVEAEPARARGNALVVNSLSNLMKSAVTLLSWRASSGQAISCADGSPRLGA